MLRPGIPSDSSGDRLDLHGVWTAWKGSGHPALGLDERADPQDHPASSSAQGLRGFRTEDPLHSGRSYVYLGTPPPQRAGERRKENKQKGPGTDRKIPISMHRLRYEPQDIVLEAGKQVLRDLPEITH